MKKPHHGGSQGNPSFETSLPILNRYQPVIGLEVHVQLQTKTKLFCACSTSFGSTPNENTCPICLGYPGALPVVNEKAIEFAVVLAKAVNAKIQEESYFSRKQYFYPDLPKGYQISQYDRPYCQGGQIDIGHGKSIPLERIHLEEDAGKNIHEGHYSYIDLNRAGTPLLEVVSKPAIFEVDDAVEYLKSLHSLVTHLGICDGSLEEGSFRCDVNISLRKRNQATLGTRVEIKNINSFRNVEKALIYEIIRQSDLLDAGGEVVQETRQFDAAGAKTIAMRSKEDAHDYRYFDDPDLPPVMIDDARIERIAAAMPELPSVKKARFTSELKLTEYDAELLASDPHLAKYFETVVDHLGDVSFAKLAANWIATELLNIVREQGWTLAEIGFPSLYMANLLKLIAKGRISGKMAKSILSEACLSGKDPMAIVDERNLSQITDEKIIKPIVQQVIDASPKQVAEYRGGKTKVFAYFVGQVMKLSSGKFNPEMVNALIKELLGEGGS